MKKYIWFSDTHLNLSPLPFMKRRFMKELRDSGADGLFLTGDVSIGPFLEYDLRFIARNFAGDVFFVLGNHDYHGRRMKLVHESIRKVCSEHRNLHWMTDESHISLTDDVALIGTEGWYDASLGDPTLLRYTLDWILTHDFRVLGGMTDRIKHWSDLAIDSARLIKEKLEGALKEHKTVYVLTHYPPWKDAAVVPGTSLASFWLPYNTNAVMGQAIEEVMSTRPEQNVVVLAGHTHVPCHLRVNESIECLVARASYFGKITKEETILI